MSKAKLFEKGDILDLIHTFDDPDADRWLVVDLTTSLDSRGFMHNEYIMLRKHRDVFLVDYFSKESAAGMFKVVGHADISALFENKVSAYENDLMKVFAFDQADESVKKIVQKSDSGLDLGFHKSSELNVKVDDIDETDLYYKEQDNGHTQS